MIRTLTVVALSLTTLSGCSSAGGAVAQSLAGRAAGAQLNQGWMSRSDGMTCAQLASEMQGTRAQLMNPLTAMSYRPYMQKLEAQYASQNCS